ncbi:type B 50S ribosomal protein L31 [Streptomyces sp. NPDC088731]|uniref:type B 50S ribosomal protein L31 n=1 Tax=Streptomyces sp. NPDC088731 TaxID=3365878 RepID=UPI0037FF4101
MHGSSIRHPAPGGWRESDIDPELPGLLRAASSTEESWQAGSYGGPGSHTRSTASSGKTIEWEDGNTYPVVDVEISSASHPFYTGTARVLDTAGRVERFERRYGRHGAN